MKQPTCESNSKNVRNGTRNHDARSLSQRTCRTLPRSDALSIVFFRNFCHIAFLRLNLRIHPCSSATTKVCIQHLLFIRSGQNNNMTQENTKRITLERIFRSTRKTTRTSSLPQTRQTLAFENNDYQEHSCILGQFTKVVSVTIHNEQTPC